jgi:ribosomal protein S18 acetylase RimI-like enzyme
VKAGVHRNTNLSFILVAGSEVLETVLNAASKHPEIVEIYLHVHTGNEEAQRFYKRFGFEVGETVSSYYRGITPPDAFVMRKVVAPTSG